MTGRALIEGTLAYAAAGIFTAVVAFLATIPAADPVTIAGLTADAAILAGWPTLLAADAIGRRRGGAA